MRLQPWVIAIAVLAGSAIVAFTLIEKPFQMADKVGLDRNVWNTTILYPPGQEPDYTLVTQNLVKGGDGFYTPSALGNRFTMKVPAAPVGKNFSIACIIRAPSDYPGFAGALGWTFSNGGEGGRVAWPYFTIGEKEVRYTSNFAAPYYPFPITSLWIEAPPFTAIKECRVSLYVQPIL